MKNAQGVAYHGPHLLLASRRFLEARDGPDPPVAERPKNKKEVRINDSSDVSTHN